MEGIFGTFTTGAWVVLTFLFMSMWFISHHNFVWSWRRSLAITTVTFFLFVPALKIAPLSNTIKQIIAVDAILGFILLSGWAFAVNYLEINKKHAAIVAVWWAIVFFLLVSMILITSQG